MYKMEPPIDPERDRYPYCVVWTPIPVLTWIFPFLGHMGIATSTGIIRDFAGPYSVAEDNMAFGKPTKYWRLNPSKLVNGESEWDAAVSEASEIYKKRMHNLFFDNCHSHVARALNIMMYDNSKSWNMIKLAFFIFVRGKFVSAGAFAKTWLPFAVFLCLVVTLVLVVG